MRYERKTISSVVTVYIGVGVNMVFCCFCDGSFFCRFFA